jgi:hypothetical protein
MTPTEAQSAGLEAGAAILTIELQNGFLTVCRGADGDCLLRVSGVQAGTWDRLWTVLEKSGKVEWRVQR